MVLSSPRLLRPHACAQLSKCTPDPRQSPPYFPAQAWCARAPSSPSPMPVNKFADPAGIHARATPPPLQIFPHGHNVFERRAPQAPRQCTNSKIHPGSTPEPPYSLAGRVRRRVQVLLRDRSAKCSQLVSIARSSWEAAAAAAAAAAKQQQ